MSYKGYNRWGNFQRTPLASNVGQMQQASNERLTYLEQLRQQEKVRAQDYLRYMQSKSLQEQRSLDIYQSRAQENARLTQNAYENDYRVEQANLKAQSAQQAQLYKTLGDLSQTATKIAVDYSVDQRQKEFDKIFWENVAYAQNSPEEMDKLQADEAVLRSQAAQTEALYDQVKSNRDAVTANPIRQMSGWRQVAAAQGQMHGMSQFALTHLHRNFKTEVKLADGVVTSQAESFDNPEVLHAVRTRLLQQYAAPLQEYSNPAMVAKYFWEPANKQLNHLYTKELAVRNLEIQKSVEAERTTTRLNQLELQPNGNRTLSILIQEDLTSPPAVTRNEILSSLIKNYSHDSVDNPEQHFREHVSDQILNINGEDILASVALRNDPTYNEARKAAEDSERRLREKQEREAGLVGEEFVSDAVDQALLNDGKLTEPDIHDIIKSISEKGASGEFTIDTVNAAREAIGKYQALNTDKIDQEVLVKELDNKARQGTLTQQEVQDAWVSGVIDANQREYLNREVESITTLSGQKSPGGYGWSIKERAVEYGDILKQKLVGQSLDTKPHWSWRATARMAVQLYQAKFQEFRLVMDDLEAANKADLTVKQAIEKEEGAFKVLEVGDASGKQALFPQQMPGVGGPVVNPRNAVWLESTLNELDEKPDLLDSKIYVDSDDLTSVAQQVRSGSIISMPPLAQKIGDALGIDPVEVMNRQLKLAGLDVQIEKGPLDQLKEAVKSDPKLNEYMKNWQTQTNINTSIIASGNSPSRVRQGQTGINDVRSIARAAKFKDPMVAAAMWALETGYGDTYHGPNALFNIKDWTGGGTQVTTKEYTESGATQLEVARFKNYGSPLESAQDLVRWVEKVPGYHQAKTPRQLIKAIHEAGYATDPDYQNKVLRILSDQGVNVDKPIVPYGGNPKRDTIGMSPSTRSLLQSLPALPPTGTLPGNVQAYGASRSGGTRKHAGVDFDAGPNDPFYSRIGGIVTNIGYDPGGYGHYVDIYNEQLGVTERIAEGDSILVKMGQQLGPGTMVTKGTKQTGVFHYEIREGRDTTYGFGGTLDPIAFLNQHGKGF